MNEKPPYITSRKWNCRLYLKICPNCKQEAYLRLRQIYCGTKCMGEARKGVNNPAYYKPHFTGTLREYKRNHKRIYDRRGSAKQCTTCGSTHMCTWANLTGNYGDPFDYASLCSQCHSRFDRNRVAVIGHVFGGKALARI